MVESQVSHCRIEYPRLSDPNVISYGFTLEDCLSSKSVSPGSSRSGSKRHHEVGSYQIWRKGLSVIITRESFCLISFSIVAAGSQVSFSHLSFDRGYSNLECHREPRCWSRSARAHAEHEEAKERLPGRIPPGALSDSTSYLQHLTRKMGSNLCLRP